LCSEVLSREILIEVLDGNLAAALADEAAAAAAAAPLGFMV